MGPYSADCWRIELSKLALRLTQEAAAHGGTDFKSIDLSPIIEMAGATPNAKTLDDAAPSSASGIEMTPRSDMSRGLGELDAVLDLMEGKHALDHDFLMVSRERLKNARCFFRCVDAQDVAKWLDGHCQRCGVVEGDVLMDDGTPLCAKCATAEDAASEERARELGELSR